MTIPSSGTDFEEYFYTVEMTPTGDAEDPQAGPRMAPVLDDVVVLYAPWPTARVITDSEVSE